MEKFEEDHPELAKYWNDEDHLAALNTKSLENQVIYYHWERVAKRLLNSLWRFSPSRMFHEPVNPEKMNMPDYFEVVKNPVDFGTIK